MWIFDSILQIIVISDEFLQFRIVKRKMQIKIRNFALDFIYQDIIKLKQFI